MSTSNNVSASGLPLTPITIAIGDAVTIPALNLQRQGFDHMLKGSGRDLIESLAENGYQASRGFITVEPFDDRRHGHLWLAAMQEQLTTLQGFAADTKSEAKERDAAEQALASFLAEHKPDGAWKRPTYNVVDGNSRFFGIHRANGWRLARGLTPILEIDVLLFERPLTPRERIKEQIQANSNVGQTPPSAEAIAKQLGRYIEETVKDGEPAPVTPSAYSAILATTNRGVIGDDENDAKAQKKLSNLVNQTRPAVVLNYYYPALRILDRLGATAPVDGQTPLTFNTAFDQGKLSAYNELLRRCIPSIRIAENDKRRKACKNAGTLFIEASSAEHGRIIKELRTKNVRAPFTENDKLELTEPTLEEVTDLVNGAKAKKKEAAKLAVDAVIDTYDKPNQSQGSKRMLELASALKGDNTSDAMKRTQELVPLLDASANVADSVDWLKLVGEVPTEQRSTVKELLPVISAVPEERRDSIADLVDAASQIDSDHFELLLSVLDLPSDKVPEVAKYIAKRIPAPVVPTAPTESNETATA